MKEERGCDWLGPLSNFNYRCRPICYVTSLSSPCPAFWTDLKGLTEAETRAFACVVSVSPPGPLVTRWLSQSS